MSSWPAGSRRRGRGARDSGTNSAVATIAGDRPEPQRHAADRAPHPDGPGPGRGVRVGRGDDRQGDRRQHGPADRLQPAAGDEPDGRGGQRAQGGGGGEQDQSGHEDPFAPEPVRHGAGGEQEGGDHEGVGVHHPLQLGRRGAQARADHRQGDVDEDRVHRGDEQRGAAGRQDEAGADAAPAHARAAGDGGAGGVGGVGGDGVGRIGGGLAGRVGAAGLGLGIGSGRGGLGWGAAHGVLSGSKGWIDGGARHARAPGTAGVMSGTRAYSSKPSPLIIGVRGCAVSGAGAGVLTDEATGAAYRSTAPPNP